MIACIGTVTAAAAEYGLRVDIQPANFTTADLAQAIANYYSKSVNNPRKSVCYTGADVYVD